MTIRIRPTPYPRRGPLELLPAVVDGEVVDPSPPPVPRFAPPTAPPVESGRPERPPRVARAESTEGRRGPRVAILTLREVRPIEDFGGISEAEDALRDALSAAMYRVVLASPRFSKGTFARSGVRRMLGTSRLMYPYRVEHHQPDGEPSDVLLVLARDLPDAATLVGVPDWYELAHRVVVHIGVVTERDLRRYPELVSVLRRRADALFSGSEMPPLGHLRSQRLTTVGVLPPLLDVLAFPVRGEDGERTIDVFAPGATSPAQNELLRQWASQHAGQYQQDIGQLGAITSLDQHRRIFTAMATRSRVFLANHHRFGERKQAGAHREVGSRFYEAMAAGCALVGDLPVGSRQFAEFVAPAGPMQLDPAATGLPGDVAAALQDREHSHRLGTAARVTALRLNDVAHRWRDMAALAGIPGSPGIEERIAWLGELADALTAASGATGSAGDGGRDAAFDGA
ncbi:MAG TPA: hypothetical protein VGH99_06140 [Pseudonocardia sp.]